MLFYRDLVLYESADTIELTDDIKTSILKALEAWKKANENHKDELLYVIYDKGIKDKEQLPLEDIQNSQMKIKNSLATLDITITELIRNQIPKSGESLLFTCVIVKPNKEKDAEIVEIGKGTIIIPQGFEIVYKMENSVLLNGNVGSVIKIEYNIDTENINIKIDESKSSKTEQTSGKTTTTPVVVPEIAMSDLEAAKKAAAEAAAKTGAETDALNDILNK